MIKDLILFGTEDSHLRVGLITLEDVKAELNICSLNEELLETVSKMNFEMKFHYNEGVGFTIQRINEMIDFLIKLKEEVKERTEDNEKKEQKIMRKKNKKIKWGKLFNTVEKSLENGVTVESIKEELNQLRLQQTLQSYSENIIVSIGMDWNEDYTDSISQVNKMVKFLLKLKGKLKEVKGNFKEEY